MEKILELLFSLFYLASIILFSFTVIRKGVLHFRLLKEIYPDEMKKAQSFFLYILWHQYTIDNDISLWMWVPFYFNNYPPEKMTQKALDFHYQLKRNNRKMVIFFLCIIISIVIIIISST